MRELSPAAPRKLRHTRQITMSGYEREDGLWDIEVREYDLSVPRARGAAVRKAGDPIHLMSLRLTFNDDLVIVAAEAVSHQVPYADCQQVGPNYQKLVGLKVEAGFNQAVKARFKGAQGCTHMTEMVGPLATAAWQTIRPALDLRREVRGEALREDGAKPILLDSCHALRRGGEPAVVRWGELAK
jgi:hypothetical protein